MKAIVFISITLLLAGCEDTRQIFAAKKRDIAYFQCADLGGYVYATITHEKNADSRSSGEIWYLNNKVQTPVVEHNTLSFFGLSRKDLWGQQRFWEQEDFDPDDTSHTLRVNMTTGRFDAWIFTGDSTESGGKLGYLYSGSCDKVDPVIDRYRGERIDSN